jgi:iron complex outermembrane receptor protein
VLWAALAVNAAMFLVEVVAGAGAGSSALQADALDFLADAANYAISLFVLGAALRTRATAALLKGLSMGAFGVWVVGRALYHAAVGGVPAGEVMGMVGALALAANVGVALLLYRYRAGDSNRRSVWLCSRNDAVGNVAVALAGGAVLLTGRGWPDVVVALGMAALALSGARQIVRHALAERRGAEAAPAAPTGEGRTRRAAGTALVLAAAAALPARAAAAQAPSPDSAATLTVTVRQDTAPVVGATVRTLGTAPVVGAVTGAGGRATLRLPAGPTALVVARVGLGADTLRLALRTGQDTAVVVTLAARAAALAGVVVNATRAGRRIEDEPLRVEVLEPEEIEEKIMMTPGDISMMLNETSGLRVQTTSPSLGGANVRVQGLRGRYTLILSDGLPLAGGQSGSLGLLQIPPMDLGQVEVIKGAASALYGSSALGGVINLVSRRPGDTPDREVLANQTTRNGTDLVGYGAQRFSERWGASFLGSLHRQSRVDVDGDGWTDMPGYERAVLRPRAFVDLGAGRSILATAGFTAEDRAGGTVAGRLAPDGAGYAEALATRRADAGLVGRFLLGRAGLLTLRGSATEQRHRHTFGDDREGDRHQTAFGEAALAGTRGRATYVVGAAFQREGYANDDVAGFDYTYAIPAAFAQADVTPVPWLSLSATGRTDWHSDYGTFVNPRLSALVRLPERGPLTEWTARLSAGTGAFAPTPFTEETEVVGLARVVPLFGLEAERATSGSADLGGTLATPVGPVELNATLFGSRVRDALLVRDLPAPATEAPGAPGRLQLVHGATPTRTAGGELLARYTAEPWHVTASYTHLRSTEADPDGLAAGSRRRTPLTPRHAAGLVGMWEQEGRTRLGLEVYYTARQALDENPYRTESRSYVLFGLLAERRVATRLGAARLFVNLENLGDVRQTRTDPLLRPGRGAGGRWTVDAWAPLEGRVINAGVRWDVGRALASGADGDEAP